MTPLGSNVKHQDSASASGCVCVCVYTCIVRFEGHTATNSILGGNTSKHGQDAVALLFAFALLCIKPHPCTVVVHLYMYHTIYCWMYHNTPQAAIPSKHAVSKLSLQRGYRGAACIKSRHA